MDAFELKSLLLKSGFSEYWHPGKYNREKVKVLGFQHTKYGVVYLKHDPEKPSIPQTCFPLVIDGSYEKVLSTLLENDVQFSWNIEKPAFYNSNLRGFPSRVNPEYNGKKDDPRPEKYGIDLKIATREGLMELFVLLERSNIETSFTGRKSLGELNPHEERVPIEIKTRRGQPEFRQRMLSLFRRKCCITGCNIESVLEAAHIISHAENTNYSDDNGLLLRADIHTLFDLDLIGIDKSGIVHIHSSLKGSEYALYENIKIKEIVSNQMKSNLKARFDAFGNKKVSF